MEPKDFYLINHNTSICIHTDEHHRNTVHLLRACHVTHTSQPLTPSSANHPVKKGI